jgi:hypothetical protein
MLTVQESIEQLNPSGNVGIRNIFPIKAEQNARCLDHVLVAYQSTT